MTSHVLQKQIEAILDVARWAPSGDNAQPWSFRIISDRDIEVLVRRTNPNIYEYRQGEPTLISAGGLLENMQIAAPAFGLRASWHYVGSADGIDHIAVHFSDGEIVSAPDLFGEIRQRSVDRRPFKLRPLLGQQKHQLSEALGSAMEIEWFETLRKRRRIAALSGLATKIRLTIPETFLVHRRIVDWENRESKHAIPADALGLDRLTLQLTRWSMASWGRTKFMNAMGAPGFASLQMDLLPGLFSAAYFVVRRKRRSDDPGTALMDSLQAGQAVQRLWLTATQLGLAMQPCVAIVAFWSYAAAEQAFTTNSKARRTAEKLAAHAAEILGPNDEIAFLGRIGWPGRKSRSRSVRLPLDQLLVR